MSPELPRRARIRFERIEKSLQGYRELLDSIHRTDFTAPELAAFAYLLETVYTELEQVFKQIARDVDGVSPTNTESWHRDLLAGIAAPNEKRTAVVTEGTRVRLAELLQFRHFARYSTAPDLSWPKMRPLVLGVEETARLAMADIERFLDTLSGTID